MDPRTILTTKDHSSVSDVIRKDYSGGPLRRSNLDLRHLVNDESSRRTTIKKSFISQKGLTRVRRY